MVATLLIFLAKVAVVGVIAIGAVVVLAALVIRQRNRDQERRS